MQDHEIAIVRLWTLMVAIPVQHLYDGRHKRDQAYKADLQIDLVDHALGVVRSSLRACRNNT